MAPFVGFKPPKTAEEEMAEGAMNPAEFLSHFKKTGGKLIGN